MRRRPPLLDERPTFEVYVLNSFAEYLWRWLELAAAGYRVAIDGGS